MTFLGSFGTRSPQFVFPYRHFPRTAALCALCLCGLVALFIGLQALAIGSTHDKRIIVTLNHALDAGILDGRNFPMSAYGHYGLDNDMFTECIALSTNLGNSKTVPLIERVAKTPYIPFVRVDSLDPCGTFIAALRRNDVHPDQPYFRYWHGHQVYLRPLLANTSLENVRRLNALLLITALGAFVTVMVRHAGMMAAPLLLVPLIAGTNLLTTPLSTVHALSWIWAYFSLAIAAHRLFRHEANEPSTLAIIFSLGCVAAFFDVLFSPPFAPTFMAFIVIAAGLPTRGLWRHLYDAATVAFVWFAGFSLSWMSKWVFAAAVLGWEVVRRDVFGAVAVRSFGDKTLDHVPQTIFTATRLAFNAQNHALLQIAAGLSLVTVLIAVWLGVPWRSLALRVLALLAPLMIPIVWVEVLRDHTLYHAQFAARSFVYFAIIPLMAALYVWPHGLARARLRWLAAALVSPINRLRSKARRQQHRPLWVPAQNAPLASAPATYRSVR